MSPDRAREFIGSTLDQLAESGETDMQKRFMLLEELENLDLIGVDQNTLLEDYLGSVKKLGSYGPTDALPGSFFLRKALGILAPAIGSNKDDWVRIKKEWEDISKKYPEGGYDRKSIHEDLTEIMGINGISLEYSKDVSYVPKRTGNLFFEGTVLDGPPVSSRGRERLPYQSLKQLRTEPLDYNYLEIAKDLSTRLSNEYPSCQIIWYDRLIVAINGLGLEEFLDNLASFYDSDTRKRLSIEAYVGDHDRFAKLMGEPSLPRYSLPSYLFTDGRIEGVEIINDNHVLKIGSEPITYIAWSLEESSEFFMQTPLKTSGLKKVLRESKRGRFNLSCTSIAPRGSWGK